MNGEDLTMSVMICFACLPLIIIFYELRVDCGTRLEMTQAIRVLELMSIWACRSIKLFTVALK